MRLTAALGLLSFLSTGPPDFGAGMLQQSTVRGSWMPFLALGPPPAPSGAQQARPRPHAQRPSLSETARDGRTENGPKPSPRATHARTLDHQLRLALAFPVSCRAYATHDTVRYTVCTSLVHLVHIYVHTSRQVRGSTRHRQHYARRGAAARGWIVLVLPKGAVRCTSY